MKAIKIITALFIFFFLLFSVEQIQAQGGIIKKMKNAIGGGKNAKADLGLELSVDNPNASVGMTVIFKIVVTNYGPAEASGVKVTNQLPSGYTYVSSSPYSGGYDNGTGLWTIGTLAKDSSASLDVTATVNADGDYMDLAEVIASDQQDPDSKPADGVDTDHDNFVVDDPDDDDDGDGQDLQSELSVNSSKVNNTTPAGIKAFLKDHKGKTQTYIFDGKTVAMRVEFDPKEKQKPMYFDNAGYVYTSNKKQGYVKVPFEKLKKMMNFRTFVSGGVLPPIDFPDGSITYYGMDVSPKKFPILEWAFVYKTVHFEGNADFNKETLDCRGEGNCLKYTLINGTDAGSYVLFDSKGRLAEIFSINSGNAVYTYQDNPVQLPNAREMPFF